MKKFYLSLLLAFLATASSSVFAQISVGPKAGYNFNSFRGTGEYKNGVDAVSGYNFGGFAKYQVLDFLIARAEVIYSQQGANIYDYQVLSDLQRKDVKVKFHNIQVPILAELGLPSLTESSVQPKLMLGGFYSYTLSAQETYDNGVNVSGRQVNYEGSMDVSSQYIPSQYGFIVGAGAEVELFNYPVAFEIRYQHTIPAINESGSEKYMNLKPTTAAWGKDLYIHTLSINVSVTLANF